jgi:hypothetical protein
MKVRSRASSIMSGASTPGGGAFRSLNENDLRKADAALSHVQADAAIAEAQADNLSEVQSEASLSNASAAHVNGVNGTTL